MDDFHDEREKMKCLGNSVDYRHTIWNPKRSGVINVANIIFFPPILQVVNGLDILKACY